jgi:hypothetical protein
VPRYHRVTRRAGCQKATTELSLQNLQSLSHIRNPKNTSQLTSPQGEADGVTDGRMTLQAWGRGEFALWLVPRQRVAPPLLEDENTHTHLPLHCLLILPGHHLDCYFYALLPPCHLFPLLSPPSDPSVTHCVQLAHHCLLIVIFKGGPPSSHCGVSPPVLSMGWALSRSSPPPSSPSPLTSLAYPSIVHHILPGHHRQSIKSCNCLH